MGHRIRIDMGTWIGAQALAAGVHLDAGETGVFARQLEHIQAQTYDVRYADLKGTELVPVNSGIDAGAEFFTWRQFDKTGNAKRIVNAADDLPGVEIVGAENTGRIAGYGASYSYSIQEMRRAEMIRASFGNVDLDAKRALAARETVARKIDNIIAFGDVEVGSTGFTNASSVSVISPPSGGAWAAMLIADPAGAPLAILNDLYFTERSINTATAGVEHGDTMALPPSLMGIIATTPVSSINPEMTILKVFLANSRYIKAVEEWNQLTTAGSGSATRIVTYRRASTHVEAILPVEFTQEPPQARNLAFVVNCHARCGGTVFYYPKSANYMDAC